MKKVRDKTQNRNKAKTSMTTDERTATVASFMWLLKDLDSGQEVLCPFWLFCFVAGSLARKT